MRIPKSRTVMVLAVILLLAIVLPFDLYAREATYNFNSQTPSNAALRSLMLPGWGQFFNNQPTKGYIFAGAAVLAVGGAFMMYSKANSTYSDYETKRTATLYDDYTSQVDTANLFVYAAAAIWVVNIFDAYMSAPSEAEGACLPNKGFALEAKSRNEFLLKYRYAF
jgi:hypothetical protein